MKSTKKPIYLDHNATTPVDPHVLKVMLPYFTEIYGNAASIDHNYGYEAKQAVDKARQQIAKVLNARPDEIIFTSGATESDNIALFGVAEKYAKQGNHIITCATEHKAILDCCTRLESLGKEITYLPVDKYGQVDPQAVEQAITPHTILISIMAANNEIGTIAPLTDIAKIAKKHNILFHTDATQAVGHIPLDVKTMNIDILSLSAHKIYGPKGVGALYRRRSNPRAKLAPVIYGGGHEKGLRSGTLNVPGIVGFGEAVALAHKRMANDEKRYKRWTDYIYNALKENLGPVLLNGHPTNRLAHNLSISLVGIKSKAMLVSLQGIAISAGSACTTTTIEPSHVIKALGFGDDRAHTALRISVGRFNTDEEIEMAVDRIIKAARALSAMGSVF